MNSQAQTLAALAIVALTAAWFLFRALRRRKKGACHCSSCPVSKPRPK